MGALLAASAVGFGPSSAYAQESNLPECFGSAASGSAAAFLGTTFTPRETCEYSLNRSSGFRALSGGATTFLAALGRLGWRTPQLPVLYGRPRDQTATPASSLILAHCTDFVMEAQGAFAVQPDPNARRLSVRRASSACGAPQMELEFACSAGGDRQALSRSQSSVTLPECAGVWNVVARVEGTTSYPLGDVRSGRPTALLDYFASDAAQRELLVPDFSRSERGLSLRRGADAEDELWAELQLAVAAGSLRFVRGSGPNVCEVGQRIGATALTDRIELDSGPMARFMTERYGQEGASLVPAATEWMALLGDVSVCMVSSHGVHRATMHAKALGSLTALELIARATPAARVCVDEPRVSLRPDGVQELDRSSQCFTTGDGATLVTLAGATLSELPAEVLLCHGEDSQGPAPITLQRGFYELRLASSGGCRGASGLSAGRIAVLDPAQDWAPVGLTRDPDGETGDAVPGWRGVRRDDPATFAFRHHEDDLRFRIAVPEGIASSWNDPRSGRQSVLSDQAPLVGVETGDYGHAGVSAFAVAVTSGGRCPVDEEGQVRSGALIESAAELRVDQKIYAHLVLREAGRSRCVARAALRVWQARVVAHAVGSERWHGRLGILGDPRLGVFFSKPDPWAVGLVVPLVHFDMQFNHGFDLEFSVPFIASIAADGHASRIGPAFMVGLDWGLPSRAQNLFTVGFLVHPNWPHPDDQAYSFFFGLNLGGLYELIGGR
ncbi:MAG: hypothetical protein H6726_00530 [Sandaracinaceae bacterium]|nr:hypothetical protein [Sandaracinaceae bacterium]